MACVVCGEYTQGERLVVDVFFPEKPYVSMRADHCPKCGRDLRLPVARVTYWVIFYEEVSRSPDIFDNEDAARRWFGEVSEAWNCTLFRSVAQNWQDDPVTVSPEVPE